jgi:hypothetical protein
MELLINYNMIHTRLIVEMLSESDNMSDSDIAIAKGRYEMPSNLKGIKNYIKLRRNGNK